MYKFTKYLLVTITAIFMSSQQSSFASDMSFSKLNCVINAIKEKGMAPVELNPSEQAFKLEISFNNPIDARNDTGFTKYHNVNYKITFLSATGIRTINTPYSLSQETSAYGYELHSQMGGIAGSRYGSLISVQPAIEKKWLGAETLSGYEGSVQINAIVDGQETLIMGAEGLGTILFCSPS